VIIANLTPFRGACIDDGTAFEIGYGFSQGLKVCGYTEYFKKSLIDITNEYFDINKQPEFTIIENFNGHPVNLMIYESIKESGGFICETFEEVIKKMCES
jgi:nucleoside 2-deoxyribosyltransferase